MIYIIEFGTIPTTILYTVGGGGGGGGWESVLMAG